MTHQSLRPQDAWVERKYSGGQDVRQHLTASIFLPRKSRSVFSTPATQSRKERRDVPDQAEFDKLIDRTKPLTALVPQFERVFSSNGVRVHDVFGAASKVLAAHRFYSNARREIG